MIELLGLYEAPTLLKKQLSELGILSKSTHSKIGLNQDAGLRFLGWDDNAAAVARALQSRKKATALITAGFPISIKPCPRSGSVPFLLKTQKSLWGNGCSSRYPSDCSSDCSSRVPVF